MLSSLFKATAILLVCIAAPTLQKLEAIQRMYSPDIVQISVTHLQEVKEQLTNGLGITWGPDQQQTVYIDLEDDTTQEVQLTRVYSVSSHPYIELVRADPQVGPWAPFNDEFGIRPRTTLVWSIDFPKFVAAKHQMAKNLTQMAEGPGFAYFRTVAGTQLEVVSSFLVPNPDEGVPNTPPPSIIDLGAMNHVSIPVLADLGDPTAIPRADILLRQKISSATGGITWDSITQYLTPLPYFDGNDQFVFFTHPNLEYSCQGNPFINPVSAIPTAAPFGATENSTTFSHAWVPPGSGFDSAGVAAMTAAENQMIAAGFQSTLRLDAQIIGLGVPTNIFHYFTGVDNIDIQLLNGAFENRPTGACKNQ